ncbi:MAG: tRNA lysidine(34) synthetase TilS [Actinomycetota bacterium]|nr:tRNA lysidine(34) synthetase TilS [Actinomycetota bacterium]
METVRKFNMIDLGNSVIISVSGGPDSVFLTYFFHLIKNEYKLKLYAFHLDHMTRNGESVKDADFVKSFCSNLGIKIFSDRINVREWCNERKLGFQEGARILRKNLLGKYVMENSIDKIAIAHNSDDNLETFFMNLLRGSGLRGVSAIKPFNGNIIRPLINSSKKEIISFLNSNKINYRIDETNFEVKYLRNKIRNILIPKLEAEFGISFKNNILDTIGILRSVNDYVEAKALKIIKKIVGVQGIDINDIHKIGFIKIPVIIFKNLDHSIKTALIFKSIEIINGEAKDIISANINDILKFCYFGGEKKKIDLLNGITFFKEKDHIYIFDSNKIKIDETLDKNYLTLKCDKEHKIIDEDDMKTMLEKGIAGNTVLRSAANKKTSNKVQDNDENEAILTVNTFDISEIDKDTIINSCANEAYMDLNSIRFPVIVRNWNKGDKFYPFGMAKEKKLQDFFTDTKIPFHLRSSIPIFCDSEKIIWIGNLRIDNRVKIREETKKILHLKIAKK